MPPKHALAGIERLPDALKRHLTPKPSAELAGTKRLPKALLRARGARAERTRASDENWGWMTHMSLPCPAGGRTKPTRRRMRDARGARSLRAARRAARI